MQPVAGRVCNKHLFLLPQPSLLVSQAFVSSLLQALRQLPLCPLLRCTLRRCLQRRLLRRLLLQPALLLRSQVLRMLADHLLLHRPAVQLLRLKDLPALLVQRLLPLRRGVVRLISMDLMLLRCVAALPPLLIGSLLLGLHLKPLLLLPRLLRLRMRRLLRRSEAMVVLQRRGVRVQRRGRRVGMDLQKRSALQMLHPQMLLL